MDDSIKTELKNQVETTAPSAPSPKAKSKGGNITTNVNQAATELVTQSAKDGLETGRKANDAFALAFAQTRKAGTAKMLESVESANEATASAVASLLRGSRTSTV